MLFDRVATSPAMEDIVPRACHCDCNVSVSPAQAQLDLKQDVEEASICCETSPSNTRSH